MTDVLKGQLEEILQALIEIVRGNLDHRLPVEDTHSAVDAIRVAINMTAEELYSRDVQRKTLERELHATQRMEAIGRLAGGIAHDFSNILTVIHGLSTLLLKDFDCRDPAYNHVQTIRLAADRGTTLTRQLLAFCRRQPASPTVLNLNAVAGDLCGMLERIIGEHIELVVNLGEELGQVRADRSQLEQVLINLAINSRDAMPNGGELTIQTINIRLDRHQSVGHALEKKEPYVMLSVTDNGVGMTEEVQEHIFEPFFTTKKEGEGIGLGLSTVYGIVKQNNGHIRVCSEPAKGTTFEVYLPQIREADANQEAKPAQTAKPTAVEGNETVLVVDDDKSVRSVAWRILLSAGYVVLQAESEGDAVLIAEQHDGPIHLLLTDVDMPRLSGPELAQRLAGVRPHMRVLYMSGQIGDADMKRHVPHQNISLVHKPFTWDSLLRKVRMVLDAADKDAE